MIINANWFQILSELFVNLAAGWLAALIIVPNFTEKKRVEKLIILTGDILGVIVS